MHLKSNFFNRAKTNLIFLVGFIFVFNLFPGTTSAAGEVIETIPDCKCYTVGSAEANQPGGTTLAYSNDSQATWTYVPIDGGGGLDCNVTDIKLIYDEADYAGSVGEDLEAEFVGTFSQTETVSDGNGKVALSSGNGSGTQVFAGSTGSDYAWGSGVAFDSSDNRYVSGTLWGTYDFDSTSGTDIRASSGDYNSFFSKYNADGSYGWTHALESSDRNDIYGITVNGADEVFVTGAFQGTVDFDDTSGTDSRTASSYGSVFITKYESDGSYGWTRIFGANADSLNEDTGYAITHDSDGNVFVTGQFSGTVDFDDTGGTDNRSSLGQIDTFITKYNADGSYGWTRAFGGALYDRGMGIATDSSGNVYAAGSFYGTVDFDATGGVDSRTSAGLDDAFVVKYNADGSYGWVHKFGSTGGDSAEDVAVDGSGNVLVSGGFNGTVDFDYTGGTDNHTSNDDDVFITKHNADGSYGWARTFGAADYEWVYSMAVGSDGAAYVAGYYAETVDFDDTGGTDNHTSNGSYDMFVTRYDTDGSYGWTRTFGGIDWDDLEGVGVDSNDNVFVTGAYVSTVDFDGTSGTDEYTSSGYGDVFVTKYASDGSYGSLFSIYQSSGEYQTMISPADPLSSWDTLTIAQDTPASTSLLHEVFAADCTTSLVAQTADVTIDLSGIDISNDQLCLRSVFDTTDDQATPALDAWEASYISTQPSLIFSIQDDPACSAIDDGDDEDEDLSIELLDIKNITTDSVKLRVDVSNYDHKTLDFKVRVRNVATGKIDTVKFTKKVKSDGKTSLVIEDLLPGTEYTFKVKVSEEDEDDYTDYSNTKRATTEEESEEDLDGPAAEPVIPEDPALPEVTEEELIMDNDQATKPEPTTSASVDEDVSENSAMAFLEDAGMEELPTALKIIGLMTGASIAVAATSIPLLPASPTPVSSGFSRFMSLFGILTKKSKRKDDWGVVFDAQTRRPIPDVAVAIVTSNKIVDTVVTDQEGRFGFLASPGEYVLQVAKNKYELYAKDEVDELYGDLYTGKPFTIKEGEMVKMNIAMETTSIDWKEFVQRKLAAYTSLWSVIKKDFFVILFYTGFIASAAILYFSPTILNLAIILIYLAMMIYNFFFKAKSFGMITNQEKKPVPFAVISFYQEDQPDQRIAFAVSDVFGRYYQLIQNGTYLMKVQGQSISGQPFVKTLGIEVREGVAREDVVV